MFSLVCPRLALIPLKLAYAQAYITRRPIQWAAACRFVVGAKGLGLYVKDVVTRALRLGGGIDDEPAVIP